MIHNVKPTSFPYTSFVTDKPLLWPCAPLNSAVSPRTGWVLTALRLVHVFVDVFSLYVCLIHPRTVRSVNHRQGFGIFTDVLRLIGY